MGKAEEKGVVQTRSAILDRKEFDYRIQSYITLLQASIGYLQVVTA